jgi:hypothetical protein
MPDTDERAALSTLAEETGWTRRIAERNDYFDKGTIRVHTVWTGDTLLSGGTLYHDDILTSFSRDVATVKGWLRR